jgi:hypothetical protein
MTVIVMFAVVGLVAASGCGSSGSASLPTLGDVPVTVELGALPEPLTPDEGAASVPTIAFGTTTTTTEPDPEPITGPIGREVFANRILLIGDTVLASTAPRHDGAMCDVLEAFGWQAEIAAEFGRFVEFGRTVVEARVTPTAPEWDAAAVMLGNHFDGDLDGFETELNDLIAALAPRPTLVYTLAEVDADRAALNAIIRDLPRFHPNVVVLDFADVVAVDPDVVLADTPSGLSDEGLGRLALHTAATLGEPPTTDNAGCVPPVFVDDSAIVL